MNKTAVVKGGLRKARIVVHGAALHILGLSIHGAPANSHAIGKSFLTVSADRAQVVSKVTAPAARSISFLQEVTVCSCFGLAFLISELEHVSGQAAVIDILVAHLLDAVEAAVFLLGIH
jgi:hypothetical protein